MDVPIKSYVIGGDKMTRISGISERNRPSAGWPSDKPNEDSYVFWTNGDLFGAAVMDGIPVLRTKDGKLSNREGPYPPSANGKAASDIAIRVISDALRGTESGANPDTRMREAFEAVNNAIGAENKSRVLFDTAHPSQWLGTVGCAVWGDARKGKAVFGFIGDPIGFFVKKSDDFLLLAEEQLYPFRAHFEKEQHRGEDEVKMRLWQDEHTRNVSSGRCWCGEEIRGWGALTGEPGAMPYVKVSEFKISSGDRLILASDAVCIYGKNRGEERRPEDYREVVESVRRLGPEEAAKELVRLTRECEEAVGGKSDDATFVVIDF